ncbi:histidine phosphatase family protein [Cellulomonas denverensis]|uniref:Histidine phosphatase family protein n=1 Tax=Cellulomonas denverensis TaxID=264297 RepID=A0A7X6KYE5_9CELL|nr:histidine phosphatase family protein [Cellulomonas denverensis]NKY24464.1 histidine phosphatase family protein [Cellulomonas denverensis]GIG25380.1 phosphoglycerate mutase [Cellulomonas denverensis]
MTAGRVVLWRHGRTAWNAGARLQGQSDIPLDEVGLWQAATAAQALAAQHRPARIVSSDLGRAHATAQALADVTGIPVQTDQRLRERSFGVWEGLTAEEIDAGWPEEQKVWRAGGHPEGINAETRATVQSRVVEAVESHAADLGRNDVLVVVSHGAAIGAGLTGLLGLPAEWRGLSGMANAHWAEVVPSRRGHDPAWMVQVLNFGPVWASSDWNSGPDTEAATLDEEVRDPA